VYALVSLTVYQVLSWRCCRLAGYILNIYLVYTLGQPDGLSSIVLSSIVLVMPSDSQIHTEYLLSVRIGQPDGLSSIVLVMPSDWLDTYQIFTGCTCWSAWRPSSIVSVMLLDYPDTYWIFTGCMHGQLTSYPVFRPHHRQYWIGRQLTNDAPSEYSVCIWVINSITETILDWTSGWPTCTPSEYLVCIQPIRWHHQDNTR